MRSALGAFYRALAIGTMSVVAPISASGVTLPVAVGLATGDAPSSLQAAGLALTVVGVVLASREPRTRASRAARLAREHRRSRSSPRSASGRSSRCPTARPTTSVLWLLVISRATAVVLLVGVLAAMRARRRAPAGARRSACSRSSASLDLAATGLYALANTKGALSIVAVVGSLYPVLDRAARARRPATSACARVQAVGVALGVPRRRGGRRRRAERRSLRACRPWPTSPRPSSRCSSSRRMLAGAAVRAPGVDARTAGPAGRAVAPAVLRRRRAARRHGLTALGHLGGERFAAHMAEHLLLGDLAALLLVLGLTGPMLAPVLRVRALRWIRRSPTRSPRSPLGGEPLALARRARCTRPRWTARRVHALQHALFVALGVNVWMPLFGPLPQPHWFGNLAKLGYIVAVRLLGAVLANVLMWAGHPLYDGYTAADRSSDQTAAASMMMVEGSILTLVLLRLAVPARRARGGGAPGARRARRRRAARRAGRRRRARRRAARARWLGPVQVRAPPSTHEPDLESRTIRPQPPGTPPHPAGRPRGQRPEDQAPDPVGARQASPARQTGQGGQRLPLRT